MADISPYVVMMAQRAAQSAASEGNDPHQAFADTINTYWQRTGQTTQMTPEMAQAYMQMVRGQMVGRLARGGKASDKVSKSAVDHSRGHKDSHCGPAFDGDKGLL